MYRKQTIVILHVFDYYINRYARAGPHGIAKRLAGLMHKVADNEFNIVFKIIQLPRYTILLDFLHYVASKVQSKCKRPVLYPIIAFLMMFSFKLRYAMVYKTILRLLRELFRQKSYDYIILQVNTLISAYALLNLLSEYKEVFENYHSRKLVVAYSNHAPGSPTLHMLRQKASLYTYLRKLILLLIRIELAVLKLFNLFIFPSKATLLLWIKDLARLGVGLTPLCRIPKYAYIVYNGVEVKRKKKGIIRYKLGLKQDTIIIGYVGKLLYDKGADILIKALSKIINTYNHRNIKLLIRGWGPEEQNLRELVRKLSIEDYIVFLRYVPDINDLYEDIDIFVAPQRRAAFDLVVLEALGHGLPIVASNIFANREALDEVAIFFEPENHDELANKLYMLIIDNTLRTELSHKAIKLFLERYTPISMAQNYIRAYFDMLGFQSYEYKISLEDLLNAMKGFK